MKKLIYTGLALMVFAATSCSKKYDDSPEPAETLRGSVTDVVTGAGIQTEASASSGTRVKLEELSYSATPTPTYFASMQDGTFNNTKVFKGHYRVSVEGPFVPLLQTDEAGTVVADNRKEVDISGVTTVNFQVEPFLNVEWVGEPTFNSADSTVSVQIKFSRGTSNPNFQQNISDTYLFVNYLPYVANNNRVDRFSTRIDYSGNSAPVGQTVTIKSSGKLDLHRDFYLRVGTRIAYGQNYYNYSTVKKITIP
ncbi:hypothetical protein GCM10023149_05610 [Mucilaginibacter gynuensis]|uniref:DUF3823 domain-containing protein n=1 Tax=Mucilaginibacter gynuensis TaxID=1302236 RepID=A0ABP8FTL7_9SPHI